MMRGRSLALRLAVLLASVLVVVLLAAGFVVNRAASRQLDDVIGPREQQRLALAAALIEGAQERAAGPRVIAQLVGRIAADTRGEARVIDAGGAVVAEAGRLPPDAESESLSRALAGGGALEIEVRSPSAAFLRAFNAALFLTGAVAVLALMTVAAIVASRMTRPLRELSAAARRLGQGDLSARAQGGSDAESAELAGAFNEMAERLQRSEGLRRRAASDLAHDLATPATVLESQIQAMVDGIVPADAAQLEKARAAAAGLSAVVGQLGELTQAEAAPLARQPEDVELRDLASGIVASLDGLLRERGVEAAVTGERAIALVDRGQLTRALRNVVTNAIQHAPRDTTVAIDVSPDDVVRVTDRGEGIAAEDLPYVFERFYRADPARGTSGSGIGLTVARELVVANGGTISVETTGPTGTTFRISLPRRS
jgi:two-component system sensor histidine kinase BaeS